MRTKYKLILTIIAVIGVVCVTCFAFYAFKLINKSAQEMRYFSAMSWLNAAIREELDDYYIAKGQYPPQLSDLTIPFPGDGANPGMLNNFKYVTDGTYYEISWNFQFEKEIDTYKEHIIKGKLLFTEHYINGQLFSREDFGEGLKIPKSKFKDGNAVSEKEYSND